MATEIQNAAILFVFAVLAGMIPAVIVLYTARRSHAAGPTVEELTKRLQASEARRREVAAEVDTLRRQLDDARRTNRYVRRRMFAAEAKLNQREPQP